MVISKKFYPQSRASKNDITENKCTPYTPLNNKHPVYTLNYALKIIKVFALQIRYMHKIFIRKWSLWRDQFVVAHPWLISLSSSKKIIGKLINKVMIDCLPWWWVSCQHFSFVLNVLKASSLLKVCVCTLYFGQVGLLISK